MSIFSRINLLFWIPYLIYWIIIYLISELFRWICFEKGRLTPLNYNLFRKFYFKFLIEGSTFYQHLISSLNLKGDFEMGKIFGINATTVQEFIPKGQEDVTSPEKTVFLCRFLDVNMSAKITDQVYSAKGFGSKREELLRAGTQEIEILRQGLVGWRNFQYEDGIEVEWKEIPRGVNKQKMAEAMDENLNKIPPEIRGDIADFIRGSSSPDQD